MVEFYLKKPLTDAFEIRLQAIYAHSDSIAQIEKGLINMPYVEKVIYQKDVVKVLDNNLSEIALILLAVALALLIIALVLISNTIQLQVYSKRFLINTMRLVGCPCTTVQRNKHSNMSNLLFKLILHEYHLHILSLQTHL